MSESLIDIKNVSFTYPNGDIALNTINFEIPKGKKIALLGGNGAGKSTLMLLLNGVLKPTSGSLDYEGESYKYSKKALRELRSNIGLLFPESDYQLIAPTVYEEISFGLLNMFSDEQIVRQKVEKAIQDFNKAPSVGTENCFRRCYCCSTHEFHGCLVKGVGYTNRTDR